MMRSGSYPTPLDNLLPIDTRNQIVSSFLPYSSIYLEQTPFTKAMTPGVPQFDPIFMSPKLNAYRQFQGRESYTAHLQCPPFFQFCPIPNNPRLPLCQDPMWIYPFSNELNSSDQILRPELFPSQNIDREYEDKNLNKVKGVSNENNQLNKQTDLYPEIKCKIQLNTYNKISIIGKQDGVNQIKFKKKRKPKMILKSIAKDKFRKEKKELIPDVNEMIGQNKNNNIKDLPEKKKEQIEKLEKISYQGIEHICEVPKDSLLQKNDEFEMKNIQRRSKRKMANKKYRINGKYVTKETAIDAFHIPVSEIMKSKVFLQVMNKFPKYSFSAYIDGVRFNNFDDVFFDKMSENESLVNNGITRIEIHVTKIDYTKKIVHIKISSLEEDINSEFNQIDLLPKDQIQKNVPENDLISKLIDNEPKDPDLKYNLN